jgi:hypothetical protein
VNSYDIIDKTATAMFTHPVARSNLTRRLDMSILPLSDKDIKRFWKYVDKRGENECWLWKAFVQCDGYGQFSLNGRKYRSHRVMWSIHHNKEIPPKLCICHHCDNPSCVNPYHLFLATQQENMDDMVRKGRLKGLRGERANTAKLTWEQVKTIRVIYSPDNYSSRKLAKIYGVSQATILQVVNHKTWKTDEIS